MWAERAGADGFYRLPFETAKFVETLRGIISARCVTRKSRRPRIVMLDDNLGPRFAVGFLTEGWFKDVTVMFFADGDEAMRELMDTDPDVFITDWRHPGPSGEEILRRLAERGVKYPIFVISDYLTNEMEKLATDCARLGMNVTLWSKPFDVEALHRELEKCVRTQRPI